MASGSVEERNGSSGRLKPSQSSPGNILFSPFSIGKMRLANRIVHAPMHSNYPSPDGSVSDRLLTYIDSQSKGGAGLIYVEHAAVEAPRGNNSPITLNVSHERFVAGLAELADVVHSNGAKVALQIDHAGRQASLKATRGEELISCSRVPWVPSGTIPRPMTVDEIRQMSIAFADAAARVQAAGFDAATIHAGHGYLLSSFLSPFMNDRTDEYGGSIEGRMRFLLETVAACRQRVGTDFPLLVRLNGADHISGGLSNKDVVTIARRLEEAGIDGLDMTSGTRESGQWQFPTLYMDAGLQIPDVREVRGAVTLPLIAIGKINTPELAASIVSEGIADLVSFGRELLADADLPRKVREGRSLEIRPCIYCNDCMMQIRAGRGVACTVNPRLGREARLVARNLGQSRKVIVVGGGPAGLTAAAWASQSGHSVTLYEKSGSLGGKLRLSAKLPFRSEQRRWLDLLVSENDRIGVRTLLGSEFGVSEAEAADADVLVIASGIRQEASEGAVSLVDVLESPNSVGRQLVVTDVSQEGCEAALMLAAEGRSVCLIGEQFALGVEVAVRNSLLARLAGSRVKLLGNHTVDKILAGKLVAKSEAGALVDIPFETVVLPPRAAIADHFPDDLMQFFENIIVIGDAAGSRGFMDAVSAGAAAALRI